MKWGKAEVTPAGIRLEVGTTHRFDAADTIQVNNHSFV